MSTTPRVFSSDLPASMEATIEYASTPVTELVSGHTFVNVQLGKVRHLSVLSVRRLDAYVVVKYAHEGRHGEIHLREDQTVATVAN